MSLFGTSPPGSVESATSRSQNSFFKDGFGIERSVPKPSRSQNSFFEEDYGIERSVPKPSLFTDDDNLSSQSRRKSVSKKAMRNLPQLSQVPKSYDEIFVKTRRHDNINDVIKVDAIKNILAQSRLLPQDERLILQKIFQSSQPSDLTRDEFNVLLALIGLAQACEKITLDGVLQRENDLPVPILSGSPNPLPPFTQPHDLLDNSPLKSTANTETTKFIDQRVFLDHPESDPWANSTSCQNHTSTDAHDSTNEEAYNQTCEPKKSDNQATSYAPNMKWGSVKAENVNNTFIKSAVDHAKLIVNRLDANSPRNSSGYPVDSSRLTNIDDEETIVVTLLPEKEGLFMFQHHCYHVISLKKGKRVVRRFSDFVWLLDCLHLRFPFRQLPLLPPKRVGLNGSHLAADNKFLEKRRRGLARFSNALTRHPVLSKENLVVNFLTMSTEFNVWRKQASTLIQEEFFGKKLNPQLEATLPSTLNDLFESSRAGIRKSAAIYINLCSLIDRLAKRKEGFAADQLRISRSLELLSDVTADTYTINTNNVPLLNKILMTSAKKLIDSQDLMIDESKSWELGVLEEFKKQRDSLVSMRDLFDRRDLHDHDNIPQLERAIQKNKAKLDDLLLKSGGESTEQTKKLEETIQKDQESIDSQRARRIFMKECIREELEYFQNTQNQILNLSKNWALELVKYSELQADNWKQLKEELEKLTIG
ncbi:Sorting nexin mvp1 [Golovinomyces cichoracearum]|uniref:Sorting nexin MVP1 n=1 Tax=Golovinomyces cichoracearum TaxID=62708 RepID=A0A420IWF4_9PEZI|nr:Sorting nexin mvp1 [Golovinomyces cichoracearum]